MGSAKHDWFLLRKDVISQGSYWGQIVSTHVLFLQAGSQWFIRLHDSQLRNLRQATCIDVKWKTQACKATLVTCSVYCPWINCDLSAKREGWLVQKAKISLFLINVFDFFHCPRCIIIMYKRSTCLWTFSLPFPLLQSVQLTNVAPLSCMCIWYYCYYLKINLERIIAKGSDGLMMHHHNWTEIFTLCFLSDRSHEWKLQDAFVNRIMFSVLWQYVGLHLWCVHFSLFYSCIMFL